MDNISELLQIFADKKTDNNVQISKELSDQYPYGKFPMQYTKTGQEKIRKESENRFSYNEIPEKDISNNNNIDFKSFLPFIQLMSSAKKDPKDMMKILSKLFFKDNPEYEKILSLFIKNKPQEFTKKEDFPDTNKIHISSLKRINW